MNKLQVQKKIRENYHKYHIPGCSPIHTLKRNAVFISTANSLEHELEKLKVCYDIKKNGGHFIVECCRNKPDENGKERRVDVVDLITGIEFECETDMKRAIRFINDKKVIIIPVGWSKDDEKWKVIEKRFKEVV